MINWKFNPENYDPDSYGYQLIPPGIYRVRIENAEETVSKTTNKPMIKMTLKVSGYKSNVWYYIIMDNSSPEAIKRTDNKLGSVFDSFNIPQTLNLQEWKGKVGAAEIKNELDNKNVMRHAVSWFVVRRKQDNLPAWQEHPAAPINSEMLDMDNELPPF